MSRLEATARQMWDLLPEDFKSSRAADSARGLIRPWLRRDPPPPQRVVRTLDELDEMLAYLDECAKESDDALRQGFQKFRMELALTMPSDPYSEAYRLAVMDLYEWLHGSPYELKNERSDFEFERFVNVPFPYSTQSGPTVGNHLIAMGHVLRTLDLAPKSRVLELGPGWGNTTIALAQMGHAVTAIDISKEFVDLIQARAQRVHSAVNVIAGDFAMISEIDAQFDAVLFFESFHHSTHHLELLASLDKVVAPGGRVLFAAEPIEDDYYLPWGPRLDGEALWATRSKGWFELGFRKSYFLEALRKAGWSAEQVDCAEQPSAGILVARRHRGR